MRSFYRRALCAFIILISCLWLNPASAQSDKCGEGARKIIYGAVLDGEVKEREIYSFYCFEGDAGDRIIIDVEAEERDDEADIFIALTDSDFTIIHDSTQTERSMARLIVVLPEDGFYRISITFLQGDEEVGGRFRMMLREGDERPDSSLSGGLGICPAGAYIIIPGIEMRFSIDDETVFQEYCFVAQRDVLYRIRVDPIEGNLNPSVFLFAAYGEDILDSNANSNKHTLSAQIDFVPEHDGIYILFITRQGVDEGDTEGRYQLTMENRTTEQTDACPTAFTPPSEPRLIEPSEIGDFYAFCFNGVKDVPQVLTARAQRGQLRLVTIVIGPDGEELTQETASEETFSMTMTPRETGVHFIYVFDRARRGGFLISLIEP